jgi:hypothetical protein
MTEIPEHLLKRAQAAREKTAEDAAATSASSGPSDSRIPDHLLERSKAARTGGASAGAVAVADKAAAVVAAPVGGGVPVGAGPGGHTQRLLTVVKSGSIQEVKAAPIDKVHTWPHLLGIEFVAALACTAFLFIFSWVVNAPAFASGKLQPNTKPIESSLVLLGSTRTTHHVPPHGGWCNAARHGAHHFDTCAVHRPQPVKQTGRSQVCDEHYDRSPHVLGCLGHHRLFLPRSRIQLHVPLA